MKYRIAIRAFTLRRDIPHSYILAKILEKMGCEAVICCTRNYGTVLKYWKPHAAVINTIGKIHPTIDAAPDTKIIVWPAEGALAAHSGTAAWIKERQPEGTVDKVSLYMLWGEFTRRAFLEYFPEEINRKIAICGHPKLDLIKFRPKMSHTDKSIGFLMKFAGINFYNRKPSITPLIQNPENGTKMLKFQIDQFVLMLRTIEKLIEKGGHKISIRPHPLEAPEGYAELLKKYPGKIEIDESMDFVDWAERQKVILTPASSSFIDLSLLKVPVISIDHMFLKEHKIIKEMAEKVVVTSLEGNSYKPESFEQLFDMVNSDLKAIPEADEMGPYNKDVYDWPYEGSSIRKAAENIVSCLDKCENLKNSAVYCPQSFLNIYDWYKFYKAKLLSGEFHENFNYKSGYHKIPLYYDQIVENIMNNNPVCD